MPHLRFRGFEAGDVSSALPALLPALSGTVGCPADWLTVELAGSRFLTPVAPMIEVLWFPRDGETQDAIAALLTETFETVAPTVVFRALAKRDYYENGAHFDV